MYFVMVNCEFSENLKCMDGEQVIGFITIKFENGTKTEAMTNAIARTKNLMTSKGYSEEEIASAKFSIEEMKLVSPSEIDICGEESLAYYCED